MNSTLIIALLITAIALAETFAQYCIKKSHAEGCKLYFLLGVLGYTIVSVLLYYSFEQRSMPIVNTLWNASSIILIILVSLYVYKETLTMWDWIGMIFVTIGTCLILVQGHGE
jgi:multidrug transporter EmrE-like cation transporter